MTNMQSAALIQTKYECSLDYGNAPSCEHATFRSANVYRGATTMTQRDISPQLTGTHARTQAIYDEHAAGYDAHRAKVLFEKPWLDRFLAKLPGRPEILDMGCGAGQPITSYLVSRDCQVTGMDNAVAMLEIARDRMPGTDWMFGDMRTFKLDRQFDGILSWDGFFHLSRQEQEDSIPNFAAHVRDGGALMLTIGHKEGEATGTVEGSTVYHSSLAIETYTELMKRCGFKHIDYALQDPECDFHSIILASGKQSQ